MLTDGEDSAEEENIDEASQDEGANDAKAALHPASMLHHLTHAYAPECWWTQ